MNTTKEYYIVELPKRYTPYNQILFGEWIQIGNNLRFEGITIEGDNISNYIRDEINNTLPQNILQSEKAFKINKQTYDVVLNWFDQLISEIKQFIEELPQVETKDQALAIANDNHIIITPYGKEIAETEGFIRCMADDNIPEWDILLHTDYVRFPNINKNYGYQNLDCYWDAMERGKTKYISTAMCDLVSNAISNKVTYIINQIRHMLNYRQMYH